MQNGRPHVEALSGLLIDRLASIVNDKRLIFTRYAAKLCASADDAEDLVAFATHQLLDSGLDVNHHKIEAFMFKTIRNKFLMDQRRKERGNVRYGSISDVENSVKAESFEIPDEFSPKLCAAIENLPPIFRSAIVMRELLDMEYAEMAACFGVKEQTAKSRAHRARSMLRHELNRV